MIYWFIALWPHWFTESFSQWNMRFIDSLAHCLIKFAAALLWWCTDSLLRCVIEPLFFHWLMWFSSSLVHCLLTQPVSSAWIRPCHFIGISTTVCLFADGPHTASTLHCFCTAKLSYRLLISNKFLFFETSGVAWAGHYLQIHIHAWTWADSV